GRLGEGHHQQLARVTFGLDQQAQEQCRDRVRLAGAGARVHQAPAPERDLRDGNSLHASPCSWLSRCSSKGAKTSLASASNAAECSRRSSEKLAPDPYTRCKWLSRTSSSCHSLSSPESASRLPLRSARAYASEVAGKTRSGSVWPSSKRRASASSRRAASATGRKRWCTAPGPDSGRPKSELCACPRLGPSQQYTR